jgi:hypothetical protein
MRHEIINDSFALKINLIMAGLYMLHLRSFNRFIFTSLALLGLSIASAGAAILPVGVHNDVSLNTVTNTWGWTQIYRGGYNEGNLDLSTVFAGHGTHVMLGGIFDGSSTIDVLAAVSWDDFNTYTTQHATNQFNGAEWYNNNGSLGFAGLGDTVSQNSADTAGNQERDRLSWHTFDGQAAYSELADTIQYGYRSGNNYCNGCADLDRIVFTANISPVPVPAAIWLFGSALIGFVGFSRRRKVA